MIEVGALLGADAVGGSAGAVLRDQMESKACGIRRFVAAVKESMGYAYERGVSALLIEPMSCLAEPPTLPEEIVAMGEELNDHERTPQAPRLWATAWTLHTATLMNPAPWVMTTSRSFRATLPYLRRWCT